MLTNEPLLCFYLVLSRNTWYQFTSHVDLWDSTSQPLGLKGEGLESVLTHFVLSSSSGQASDF